MVNVDLCQLMFKMEFLIAVTCQWGVVAVIWVLQALTLIRFYVDKVMLRPHVAFLPKVVSAFHISQDLTLCSFKTQIQRQEELSTH